MTTTLLRIATDDDTVSPKMLRDALADLAGVAGDRAIDRPACYEAYHAIEVAMERAIRESENLEWVLATQAVHSQRVRASLVPPHRVTA